MVSEEEAETQKRDARELRQIAIKAVTGYGILASGAIIVSINALGVLYQINGRLQHIWLIAMAWIVLFITSACAPLYCEFAAKWLAWSYDAEDGGASMHAKHNWRELWTRRGSRLSLFIGVSLLMAFMLSNLAASAPARVEQSTTTSMPANTPASATK